MEDFLGLVTDAVQFEEVVDSDDNKQVHVMRPVSGYDVGTDQFLELCEVVVVGLVLVVHVGNDWFIFELDLI